MENTDINYLIDDFCEYFIKIEELNIKRKIEDLSRKELHLLGAIGKSSVSMNELSKKVDSTMATMTTAISQLLKKGYVRRVRAVDDRRIVRVSLSDMGKKALKYHDDFHEEIFLSLVKNINETEVKNFTSVFKRILSNLENKIDYETPKILNNFTDNSLVKVVEIKGSEIIKSYFEKNEIKIGTVLALIQKNSYEIEILSNKKSIFLDLEDSKNIIGIQLGFRQDI